MIIRKAMLLAAGLGTRLRPLTDNVPKPLIPLDGKRLIDFPLQFLKRGGIDEVMINLHYMGDLIESYVGNGSRYGLRILFSHEPTILGTGGGIKNAEAFFGDEHFVVMNADTLIECELAKVMEFHTKMHADVTLVVRKLRRGETYSPVEITKDKMVTSFKQRGKHFYSGLHIAGPKLLATLPEASRAPCLIDDGFVPLLKDGGHIAAFTQIGYWNDLGTIERYEQAKREIQAQQFSL